MPFDSSSRHAQLIVRQSVDPRIILEVLSNAVNKWVADLMDITATSSVMLMPLSSTLPTDAKAAEALLASYRYHLKALGNTHSHPFIGLSHKQRPEFHASRPILAQLSALPDQWSTSVVLRNRREKGS